MKDSSISRVLWMVPRKVRIAGIHFMGCRCGSGVDVSVNMDQLVPASSCAHDIAIMANCRGMPSDRRQLMSAYSCEMPSSTGIVRISTPAKSE